MKIRFMRTDNDIFGEDEIIHPIIQIQEIMCLHKYIN